MTTHPRLVGGRYELGELIGYGGMAEVHRGRDIRLGRDVAIKVLRADLARDPSFLARFRREAQAAAGLNHPSIVSVYDTGEDTAPDGATQPYIVMEYVEGRTLRDILKTEGRLPIRRAMEIAADVCQALDFSHRNGIVHRDIKPANVMITKTGAVKVMDFGIARAVADNAATVTQTANVIGTAQYLSPEQARGEAVDARSDVYSTGCLLYELVTGVPPFQGDSPVAVAYQHVRENPVAPSSRNPEVPPALDSIVMKALAKNQLNRYQSAGEMRTDLQRALANQPVAAEAVMTDAERTQFIARTPPPPGSMPGAGDGYGDEPSHTRRTALIWTAIVVALLVVIGGGAFLILSLGNSDEVEMVKVPALFGESPTQATSQLTALGFVPITGDDTNGPCTGGTGVAGKVCTQEPASDGTVKAKKGSSVTFHLYTPAQAIVPYVVGEQYSDAFNDLRAKGLVAKKTDVDNSAPSGQVVKQDKPAGNTVAEGSTVTLSVSTGKVRLISVVGQKEANARLNLNQDGWKVSTLDSQVTTHNKSKDGTVASQNPTAGTSWPQDTTTVSLTIFHFVAPPPTCTTPPPSSPSTTPPSSPGTTPPSSPGAPSGSTTPPAVGAPSGAAAATSPGGLPPC